MSADSVESRRLRTLRGVACILLVAFHTVGNHRTSGLHVADDSGYRFFADLFQYARMPLFTFLSGFVYAYQPVLPGSLTDFARRKVTVPVSLGASCWLIPRRSRRRCMRGAPRFGISRTC